VLDVSVVIKWQTVQNNGVTTGAAIVIGIDAYATQPLTSAVNDARLFAKTLVDLGLVSSGIRLLTAPPSGEDNLPTRKHILDALRPYYTGEESVDRLFVYYAGHGLLAFSDAARALPRTALVPVDVRDLATDGDVLIDVDSVLARLRFSGPAEQFFFIDACRDLGYDDYPDMTTSLGWKAVPSGAERKQAILYAVPPLGKAQSESGGLGVMTRHLVDAFHGRGIALDYSDDLRKYVVSAESVAAYVQKRVLETIGAMPLWQRNYALPRLDHREPKAGPIREIDQPAPAHLTLYIRPQDAEPATRVRLTQMETSVCSWPPNSYRQPFPVKPHRYWLEAESDAGWLDPPMRRIDVREQDQATIDIQPPPLSDPTVPPPLVEEPVPGDVMSTILDITYGRPAGLLPPPRSTVAVEALEPQSTVELEQIDPPYLRWAAAQRLDRAVAPGAYRVRFRLGRAVFSESEVDVPNRAVVTVRPMVGDSPLLREVISPSVWAWTRVVITPTMGPIQADVLPTALSFYGIKPFDRTRAYRMPFDESFPHFDPHAFGMRPVSLVLAVEGTRWPVPAGEVLSSARVVAEVAGHVTVIPILPLSDFFREGRVGLGVVEAPARSFTIRVRSPYTGAITAAAASLDRRATVIALTLRADGSFDLSQNLLQIPGRRYNENDKVAKIPHARMLRGLQLGQRLYESGELVERAGSSGLLADLLHARRTDPVLSCMAYFAGSDSGLIGKNLLARTARNLRRYWDIPDARVIYGLAFPAQRDQALSGVLDSNELPVLARSAAELARYAQERGSDDHAVVTLSRRVMPGQPWLVSWQAEQGGTTAQEPAAI